MGCPAHVLWKIRKHNINSMGHISQGTCSVTCVWEGHPVGADDVMSYATPSCVPYKGGQLLLTSFIAYKLWGSPHLLQRFFSMQVGCTQRVWMGLLHSRWRKKGKLLGVLRCRRAFVKVGNFFDHIQDHRTHPMHDQCGIGAYYPRICFWSTVVLAT